MKIAHSEGFRKGKLFASLLVFISIILAPNGLWSQGENLYKAKCSSCHQIEKNGTGPMLKGARQRWADAGEGDLIYEWVKNNAALRGSGKSKRAKQVYDEYGGSQMQLFADLSNDQIDQILNYADSSSSKAAAPGAAGAADGKAKEDAAKEEGKGGVSKTWWIMGVIFLVVIFSVSGVRRQLKNASSESEPDTNATYWQEFKLWLWKYRAATGVTLLVLTVSVLVLGLQSLGSINVMEGYQPSQPISFPHSVHAGQNGIDCKYCHNSVEKSKSAGLPTVNVCMNCHKQINGKTPEQQAQISKIYAAAGWDPNIKPAGAYTGRTSPIVWNKVHVLPDHVYFNHSQHVVAGKIDCIQCHGDMKAMKETAKVQKVEDLSKIEGNIKLTKPTLTMGWCIECHGKKEVVIDDKSNAYYDELHKRLKRDMKHYKHLREDEKITVSELGGWECSKCHY
jgi:mono/diheme cytochrome c family protein